jgi:hypothetical protein
MGFFDKKVMCSVCEEETGLNRYRIANKQWLCPSCFKKANFKINSPIRNLSVEDVKNAIEKKSENDGELELFTSTKKIGTFVEFDDDQKKWLVLSPVLGRRSKSTVYSYNDILDFELLEDGESIASGGLGRALVGGALFGGVGAVVGGVTGKRRTKGVCNNLQIKVTLNDINNPAIYITFLNSKTKKDGIIYKTNFKLAQECLSTFQIICDNKKTDPSISSLPLSEADEIKKFKELFDAGVITEEEFNKKKQALLG